MFTSLVGMGQILCLAYLHVPSMGQGQWRCPQSNLLNDYIQALSQALTVEQASFWALGKLLAGLFLITAAL